MSSLLPTNSIVERVLNSNNLPVKVWHPMECWLKDAVKAIETHDNQKFSELLSDPLTISVEWEECIFMISNDPIGLGVDPELCNLLGVAIRAKNEDAIKQLWGQKKEKLNNKPASSTDTFFGLMHEFPLGLAVREGSLNIVQFFVEQGLKPEKPQIVQGNRVWKWPNGLLTDLLDQAKPDILASPEPWIKNLLIHCAVWCENKEEYAADVEFLERYFNQWGVAFSEATWREAMHGMIMEDLNPDRSRKRMISVEEARNNAGRLAWLLNRWGSPNQEANGLNDLVKWAVGSDQFSYVHVLLTWTEGSTKRQSQLVEVFWKALSERDCFGGGIVNMPDAQSKLHEMPLFKEVIQKIAENNAFRPSKETVRSWASGFEAGVKACDYVLAAFLIRNPELALNEWQEIDSPSLRRAREEVALKKVADESRFTAAAPPPIHHSKSPSSHRRRV